MMTPMRSDLFARVKVGYSSFAFNQKKRRPRPAKLSDNLTEKFVQTEIDRQLAELPERIGRLVTPNQADLMAFALNRLPALYASTNRGRQTQEDSISDEFYIRVEKVVRQAIAAVSHDPLRTQGDCWQPVDQSEQDAALAEITKMLKFDCGWKNVAAVIRYRLIQAARGEFYVEAGQEQDGEQYLLNQQ
ncbi:MAG: late competence development ComFB family protein [Cyanobacteria bacterium J06632_3]